MRYEGTVYRPPTEADSFILQATIGCPHNRCTFCNLYMDKRFRIRKMDEILEDIDLAAEAYGAKNVRTMFLADGNTVIMKTAQLLEILNYARERFPNLQRVTSYGGSQYMIRKSLEEWTALHEAGFSRIHCGVESGCDEVLRLRNKGATRQQHIDAGKRVREAGIDLNVYFLAGLGGRELWEAHAVDSASAFNEIQPAYIRVRTLIPMYGTPLGTDYLQGRFSLMDPYEVLRELRLMVENLDVHCMFSSDHWDNFANISGVLPYDKPRMLNDIDYALKQPRSAFRSTGILSSGL